MKKLRRIIAVTLAVCLAAMLLSLSACAAKNDASADGEVSYGNEDYGYADGAIAPDLPAQDAGISGAAPGSGISGLLTVPGESFTDKIIYYVSANIETVEFDTAVAALDAVVVDFGAFVEASYVSGASYSARGTGRTQYRSASYTVRVPRERLQALVNTLPQLGSVTYLSTNAQNVTAQYADTESRLSMYRIEESRLLAMLERADTVADMITIETTLAEVRYSIERLTSDLRNLDSLIDYSSVSLTIYEVERLTEIQETYRSYGQQITDGLKATLRGVGTFFKGFVKYLIILLPVIALLAVVAAVIIVAVRARRRNARGSTAKQDALETAEVKETANTTDRNGR
ncbi:MAG: DUF4349 domain-containing protein [Oscillospiraceae bacterium]|jgi:hypothetical protein|nr:DUF4349 domain-containing protein [Oscillospiraceae bacterium]